MAVNYVTEALTADGSTEWYHICGKYSVGVGSLATFNVFGSGTAKLQVSYDKSVAIDLSGGGSMTTPTNIVVEGSCWIRVNLTGSTSPSLKATFNEIFTGTH